MGVAIVLVFIAIQFIRPSRNQSTHALPTDIVMAIAVPDDVHVVLIKACYDCHSNNTVYPWYMNLQPAAWFMASHIREGKAELNFSDFASYSKRKQAGKLRAIASQVKKGEMPLYSYTILHRDARLNNEEKELIISWASHSRDSLTKSTQ